MSSSSLTPAQRRLRRRILEISHERRASHLGSALSVADIIAAIYDVKAPEERFVLSAGHSAVALYAVLEDKGMMSKTNALDLHIHPDRNPALGIDVSTGSLGQGLPIAVGIALANRSKKVWVVTTDGEMSEGSMWEALRIASEQKLGNLKLFINVNGFGAYGPVEQAPLEARIRAFGWEVRSIDGHNPGQLRDAARPGLDGDGGPVAVVAATSSEQLPFLRGLDAHYYVMTDADFLAAREILAEYSPLGSESTALTATSNSPSGGPL